MLPDSEPLPPHPDDIGEMSAESRAMNQLGAEICRLVDAQGAMQRVLDDITTQLSRGELRNSTELQKMRYLARRIQRGDLSIPGHLD